MTTHHGWRLSAIGGPTADIICPHGHAVEFLNLWDYSRSWNDQPAQIGDADLNEWLADNQAALPLYCAAHGWRPQ